MNMVADIVETELKRHGITVYRNTPDMTVTSIVKESNSIKPDLHQAIHSNSVNKEVRGCEVFCYTLESKGAILAKNVYKYVEALTPVKDRGVKIGKDFYGKGKHMYEVAYTTSPAALLEIDYHDNLESANWIMTHRLEIGVGIAKGILETLGITYMKPVIAKTREQRAVEAMFKAGLIENKDYWLGVLEGKTEFKRGVLTAVFLNTEK